MDLLRRLASKKFIKRIISFAIIGAIGSGVYLGSLALLVELIHLWYPLAVIAASVVSILVNYFANNRWSFVDRANDNHVVGLGKFTILMVIDFSCFIPIMAILMNMGLGYGVANIIAICIRLPVKYMICAVWVWKDTAISIRQEEIIGH